MTLNPLIRTHRIPLLAGASVLILAVGISGIQQMGGKFYVEPLFNGGTLILAVGLAGYAARRRMRLNQAGQSV